MVTKWGTNSTGLNNRVDSNEVIGMKDDKLLSELMEIHSRITHLKYEWTKRFVQIGCDWFWEFFAWIFRKRDGELSIRQKELQLEYRHAQLKEQLNVRLSCGSEWTEEKPLND